MTLGGTSRLFGTAKPLHVSRKYSTSAGGASKPQCDEVLLSYSHAGDRGNFHAWNSVCRESNLDVDLAMSAVQRAQEFNGSCTTDELT